MWCSWWSITDNTKMFERGKGTVKPRIRKLVSRLSLIDILVQIWSKKQAGLSRATLEITSEHSSNFPLRTHKSQSIQLLLRYSTFNILRSSSIGGCLHFKDLWNLVLSSSLKFRIEYGPKMLAKIFNFRTLRSSSIGGHLRLRIYTIWFDPLCLSL